MRTSAEFAGAGGSSPERGSTAVPDRDGHVRPRLRLVALLAGAFPVLAFPRAGLDWLAWGALVPGLLLMRAAPTGREAAIRGWWFGAGFLSAALYWLIPNIGPALALVAVTVGVLWAPWGYAAWALLRPGRLVTGLIVVPSVWVAGEWARSWHGFGGPWALYGTTQWRHPAMLAPASVGGVWLVSLVLVAVNTALVIAITRRSVPAALLAVALTLAGPVVYAVRQPPPPSGPPMRMALVQPGVIHGPAERFAAGERITAALPRADLVVWGESSVGFDLRQRPDLVARLAALADAHGPLLVNEDARDGAGRISKSTVYIGPEGIRARYVKTRLVPFGEYVPFRRALGWLSHISKAAAEDRVPGTGIVVMRARPDLRFGPLICFESTFPDLGRALVRRGAGLIVYQSATSTFQGSWAPPQHAALGAVRAAETGRPVVQAALTGVTAAYDARGHRLAWFDTAQRGSVTVLITPTGGRTPYDRLGDYTAWLAVAVTLTAGLRAWRSRRVAAVRSARIRAGASDDNEAQ